jgi:hypothetical protein
MGKLKEQVKTQANKPVARRRAKIKVRALKGMLTEMGFKPEGAEFDLDEVEFERRRKRREVEMVDKGKASREVSIEESVEAATSTALAIEAATNDAIDADPVATADREHKELLGRYYAERTALEKLEKEQRAKEAEAREAYDLEPSEANADAAALAKHRADLMIAHKAKQVEELRAETDRALDWVKECRASKWDEAADTDALRARCDSRAERAGKLVLEFLAIYDESEADYRAVRGALIEANQLRGRDAASYIGTLNMAATYTTLYLRTTSEFIGPAPMVRFRDVVANKS